MASKNRRVFELRLGKLGLILFVCGMSLLLFSMFLLGIVVGKHMETYPERSFPGIPELIRDSLLASLPKAGRVPPPAEQGAKNEQAGSEDRFDLTFYETLGGKKERTPEEMTANTEKNRRGESPPAPAGPAANKALTGQPAMPPGSAAGKRHPPLPAGDGVVKKQDPSSEKAAAQTDKKKPEALPSAPAAEGAASPGKGRFEVQAAAYRERSKAEQMAQRLVSLGFSPKVAMKELPAKGLWFRVIVDGFESRAKAQEAADSLAGKIGGLKCIIRPSGRNGNGD
ncbi:MAG: SPOR domain-containing protein [Proteobacteria bacterium]|nr:SPOR domain-containing protein [Pseudomonadota bacterium]MBU2226088.1 SPOR domain-containing protein [Pseudomonadota bacterium]MBU2262697.1 SPOR domain-containing protein [Pseudomonadota bacterium]